MNNHLQIRLLLLLIVCIGVSGVFAYQISNNTETPEEKESLFEEDTCTPPCWFGLIAGESTNQDVIEALSSNLDTFRPLSDTSAQYHDFKTDTLPISDGFYQFYWGTRPQPNLVPTTSLLVIEDQELVWMRIGAPAFISLSDVLGKLGQPDEVYANLAPYLVYLDLFYSDLNLIVILVAERDMCDMSRISETFAVDFVYYYPTGEEAEFRQEHRVNFDVPIRPEVWNEWTDGIVQETCDTAFLNYISTPEIATTYTSIRNQINATSIASQATRNALMDVTATARANERLTVTPTPR